MGRCQQEGCFRCRILSQLEKACRCRLHFSSCTACVCVETISLIVFFSKGCIHLSFYQPVFCFAISWERLRRLGWMRLRCLSLMPEEGKGAHALDRAQLRWELSSVFAFFELSVLQFGCQNGRCQGHCGQKLSVFGRSRISDKWLSLQNGFFRKIALLTVK